MSDRRAALLALALVLAFPDAASAWCRTLTEGPPQPADLSACAPMLDRRPLFWRERCTSISLSSTAGPQALDADVVRAVLRRSLDSWQEVDCGSGARTGLDVAILDETNTCSVATHYNGGRNVHSIIFIDDAETWSRVRGHDVRAFAVTFVWHDRNTGEILDGDIEINESRGTVQVCPDSGCDGCPPEGCSATAAVDLENVLTHELGHYFGLGHTTIEYPDATMFAQAPFGEIIKRTLEPDDIDGICTAYPAGAFDESCDPVPMGGLGLDCRPGGCGCAAPGRGEGAAVEVSCLLALAVIFAGRRARQRGRQP